MSTQLIGNTLYVPVTRAAFDFYISDAGYLCAKGPVIKVMSEFPLHIEGLDPKLEVGDRVYKNGGWCVKVIVRNINKEMRKVYKRRFVKSKRKLI